HRLAERCQPRNATREDCTMARKKPVDEEIAQEAIAEEEALPEHVENVEAELDRILTHHVNLILSYAQRKPLDKLFEEHQGDPVFEMFGMTDIEFIRKRWAAGLANSCATNLGRFTDKAMKVILAGTFKLTPAVLLKK